MPDFIFMLESRLLPDQLTVLNFLQEEAQDLPLNLYLTGGAVRDLLTGSPIRDLDFVLEGNPLRLVQRFTDPAPVWVEVDEGRCSAEIVLANGVSLSLEMARSESYAAPGKAPDVQPATILDDLGRRDFTVNAMGISLTAGSRGLMLDPTNGLADIESGELRTLHNYSFLHDPSRLLRLTRFGARLGFNPDERTKEQFESAMERGYLDYLTRDHRKQELRQIARESNAVGVLKAMQASGMLKVFHPAWQRRGPDYESLGKYQKYRRQAEEAGYRFDPFHGLLYYMLRRLWAGDAKRLLRYAGLEAGEIKQTEKWLPEVKKVVAAIGRAGKTKPKKLYEMLSTVPLEVLVFAMAEFRAKGKVQSRIATHLYRHRPLRRSLPAAELEQQGLSRGPQFDEVLEKFFDAQLEGKIRASTNVPRYLRRLAGIPEPKPEPPKEEPSKKAAKARAKKSDAQSRAQRGMVRKALLKEMAARKKQVKASAKKTAQKKTAGKAQGKSKAARRPAGQSKTKVRTKSRTSRNKAGRKR